MELIKTDIIKVEEIENEFSFLFYVKKESQTNFNNENINNENKIKNVKILFNNNKFFDTKIQYILQQQQEFIDLKNTNIVNYFFDVYRDNTKTYFKKRYSKDITDKYYPVITPVSNKVIKSEHKKRRLYAKIKYYKRAYEKTKYMLHKINYEKYKRILKNNEFDFYKIVFKKSFISYFEQDFNNVYLKTEILNKLKEYTKKNGISFDVYIDNWTNELMKEFKLK